MSCLLRTLNPRQQLVEMVVVQIHSRYSLKHCEPDQYSEIDAQTHFLLVHWKVVSHSSVEVHVELKLFPEVE